MLWTDSILLKSVNIMDPLTICNGGYVNSENFLVDYFEYT